MNQEFLAVYVDQRGELVPESFLGVFTNSDQAFSAFQACKLRMMEGWHNTASHWEKVHGLNWLEKYREHGLQPGPEKISTLCVVSYPDYIAKQNQIFASKPLIEITDEKYWDLLECLPPVKWSGINGTFETFFMLEKYSGEWRDQVIKCLVNNEWRYFKKLATIDNPLTYADVLSLIK